MTYHETGKVISKKLCSTNNKEGRWTCSKITYNDGRPRNYCGCLYDIDEIDPNNILTNNKTI
jgi:hypothetical protein